MSPNTSLICVPPYLAKLIIIRYKHSLLKTRLDLKHLKIGYLNTWKNKTKTMCTGRHQRNKKIPVFVIWEQTL